MTHDLWLSLEGGAGRLHLLVTISGLAKFDDVDAAAEGENDEGRAAAAKRYGVSANLGPKPLYFLPAAKL